MATSGVGGTGSTDNTNSNMPLTQAIAGNQQLGQQDFLKLLITQLSNQDPLSPQDDKEFIAQLAQFSTVEGITNMGTSLGQLQGAGLIGKNVDVLQNTDEGPKQFSGVVSAVEFKTDGVHFTVNDTDVTLDQITKVTQG